MGLNFGQLAGKVGNMATEYARNAAVGAVGDLFGINDGQVKYAEYEYDSEGKIIGVSKYASETVASYESLGTNSINVGFVDGNFGGLTTGNPRAAKTQFLDRYPKKFAGRDVSYDNTGGDAYNNTLAENQRLQDEAKNLQKVPGLLESRAIVGGLMKTQDIQRTQGYGTISPTYNRETLESMMEEALEEEQAKINNVNNVTNNNYDNNVKSLQGMLYNDASTDNANEYNAPDNQNKVVDNPISDIYSIKLPDWNYADFINERAIWQKGLSSIFDEPGWFYFKIFFDFDTDHGLFGGLLNSKYLTNAVNSAAKYLYTIRDSHRFMKPKDRINSLYKFASILSYINTNAPWYFKSVSGLNNALTPVLNEFSKERTIDIGVTQDAIDMRLSTLMSLYNYACFDSITHREIIPANLRKFRMTIILFQTPLRYLHTSYNTNEQTEFMGINLNGVMNEVSTIGNAIGLNLGKKASNYGTHYKSMNINDSQTGNYDNAMSMKIYSFYGCEFDMSSFGGIIPGSISNEKPFQLGNSSIKISYTSCTEHTMNEFYGMMFGADGFYFNQYSNFQLNNGWNGYVNNINENVSIQKKRYDDLYNTFSDITKGKSILGLVDMPKTYKKAVDATEAIMNGLFDNPGLLGGMAANFALGLLGSSKSSYAPQGNIYGDYGIGSNYYKEKLEMLKNGVHERTEAPYYYDPDTGVRKTFNRSRSGLFSAVGYKNDINTIKNFDVTNWLNTQTQNFASKLNDGIFNYTSPYTTAPYKPNEYNKDTAQGIDEKRFEGIGKSHDMVDDPNTWNRVQKPYNYDPMNAVDAEYNKDVDVSAKQMVDIKGNPANQVTEAPFKYEASNAVKYENDKAGDPGKTQVLVDDIGNPEHEVTTAPFVYDSKNAINYENSKIEATDIGKTQILVDNIGNDEHEYTEAPFVYDPKNAVDYENSKAGDDGKTQVLTDGIGNPEHEYTEAPFVYDPKNAVDYENSKAGDDGKTQVLTDGIGNPEHEYTEAPFVYDPKNAVDYENSKAGDENKTQVLVDKIGNPEHEYTEAPFDYDPASAVDYENSKAGGENKTQVMVDKIGNPEHEYTEAPFDYNPMNAVDYENSKAGGENKTQVMVDKIGNPEHEYTEAPFDYDPMNAVDYENSKAGSEGKTQVLVDKIGNPEHEYTEAPFDYDPMNAVDYENSKAGGEGKTQVLTDGIGNPEHEMTEAPFDYDPMNAVDYENSKAGGEGKTQVLTDDVGNPEHEYTEAPFIYDPMTAVNYENSKAGGEGKTQILVDGIGNPEHEMTEAPYEYDPNAEVRVNVNETHEFTEPPYNYDPMTAVEHENSKAGSEYKTQVLVDGIGNPEHEFTEAPFNYDPMTAVNYENSKAGEEHKTQILVDKIGNPEHEYTEAPYLFDAKTDVDINLDNEHNNTTVPFNYENVNAVDYENNKAGEEHKTQVLVDKIGNPEHEYTEAPYLFDAKTDVDINLDNEHNNTTAPFNYENANAVDYENSKAGEEHKTQVLVDKIGNPEHEFTEPPYLYDPKNDENLNNSLNSEHNNTTEPFNYDPMIAVDYENEKAGEEHKTQVLVDKIGNPEHEFTEPPYLYDPMGAVEYENSKAGEEGMTQVLVDKIGNPEHEFTEPPYLYDPMNPDAKNSIEKDKTYSSNFIEEPFNYESQEAIDYENSKAGGEYKTQVMVNDGEHKFTMPPYLVLDKNKFVDTKE